MKPSSANSSRAGDLDLATDLEPGYHILEIELTFAPDEPDSQLRIENICAAERQASKEGGSHP
jgi:hypothetical protein